MLAYTHDCEPGNCQGPAGRAKRLQLHGWCGPSTDHYMYRGAGELRKGLCRRGVVEVQIVVMLLRGG